MLLTRGNKMRHILLHKKVHLITMHINTVKHLKYPWLSPWTWKNVMFDRRSVDFKTISHSRALAAGFFVFLLWRHGVEWWDCDVIADINNGWDECIIPIRSEIYAWNIRLDSRFIFFFFIFHVICIVEFTVT